MMATMSAYSTAVTPSSRSCCPPRRARSRASVAERYVCTRTGPLRFPYRSVRSFLEQLEAMPAGGSSGLPRRHDQSSYGQPAEVMVPALPTQSPVWLNAVDTLLNRRKNPATMSKAMIATMSAYSTAVTPSSRARRSATFVRTYVNIVLSRSIRLHLLPPAGATDGAVAQRQVPLPANVGLAIGETRPIAACLANALQGNLVAQGGTCPSGLVQIGPA